MTLSFVLNQIFHRFLSCSSSPRVTMKNNENLNTLGEEIDMNTNQLNPTYKHGQQEDIHDTFKSKDTNREGAKKTK
jgi:hypothetical protein